MANLPSGFDDQGGFEQEPFDGSQSPPSGGGSGTPGTSGFDVDSFDGGRFDGNPPPESSNSSFAGMGSSGQISYVSPIIGTSTFAGMGSSGVVTYATIPAPPNLGARVRTGPRRG